MRVVMNSWKRLYTVASEHDGCLAYPAELLTNEKALSPNPTPQSLNETDEWCDSLAPIAGARLGCPQKDKSGPNIDVRSIFVHAVEFSRTMAFASRDNRVETDTKKATHIERPRHIVQVGEDLLRGGHPDVRSLSHLRLKTGPARAPVSGSVESNTSHSELASLCKTVCMQVNPRRRGV
jgi:hypothetical protein